jgi:peptide/nickel transport system substrate-binding protein
MRLHSKSRPVIAGLFFLLALASCSRISKEPAPAQKILHDSVTDKVSTLDPVGVYDLPSRNATIQVYEGLLGLDKNLKVVPLLAESWTQQGSNIVFRLRQNARFHDDAAFPGAQGRSLEASDVKYSFERVLTPANKSPWTYAFTDVVLGASEFFAGKTKEVAGFHVVDPRTFEIRMTKPFAPMLARLTASGLGIVPHEAVEKYGENFKYRPVGTGPFRLTEVSPESRLVFEKNPGYWQSGTPLLDRIEVRVLRDAAIQMLEFQSGRLDSLDLSLTQFREVMDENGQPRPQFQKYRLRQSPIMNLKFLGFNLQSKPWGGNLKLRKAVSLAIDREQLVRSVLRGEAVAARSILPPGVTGYDPGRAPIPFDPRQSQKLLAEAGYPEGKGLPELLIEFETNKEKEYVAEAIVSMLGKVGVKARLDMMNEPVLLDRINAGSFTCVLGYWVGDYPAAEQFFMAFDSRNMPPTGFNLSRFRDSEFDLIFQKALLAPLESEAVLNRQAEQRVLDVYVWLPLYHNLGYKLQQPGLEGYPPHPLQYNFYKFAYWKPLPH